MRIYKARVFTLEKAKIGNVSKKFGRIKNKFREWDRLSRSAKLDQADNNEYSF